ncbi:MAG: hypothetical protein AMXMBFR56_72390 [Polyangiaceae bacterium]
MGVFSSLKGLFTRAPALPEGSKMDGGMVLPASSGGPARRGTRELIAAYREQPWLRAVTSRIARGVAAAGWSIYARSSRPSVEKATGRTRRGARGRFRDIASAPSWKWGGELGVRDVRLMHGELERRAERRRELAAAGTLREVEDHPALEVLAAPNALLTGRAAMQLTQIWLDIKGEAFWLLSFDEQGLPNGYYPVPPHWVTQMPSQEAPYFAISAGALQLRVAASSVIWFRDPDPENPYGRGTGVAEALGDELETDEFSAKYLKNWFFNNAMPSFIVSFEGAQAADLKRAKEQWEAEHRGYWNAHRAHFSSGKMNAVRLDASFRDQQIADLRRLSRDTCVQVFGVPPEMIGIIENSNRSTIDAAHYIYVLGVEYPRCEFLRTELQAQYLSRWDPALALECEVAVPDDEERRLNVLRALPGAFSVNEWRGEAGYEPLAQFDGVFPPLTQPGQQPAQGDEKPAEETPEPDDAEGETELEPERFAPMASDRIEPAWAQALSRR